MNRTLFVALYRLGLAQSPRAFRERYGPEMLSLAEARVTEQIWWRRPTRACRELLDLRRAVRAERLRDVRGRWREPVLPGVRDDLPAAVRSLWRSPAHSLAIVLVLAMGLSAGAVGFSMMSTVVLRPLPFGGADKLALLYAYVPQFQAGFPEQPLHGLRLEQLRQTIPGFSSLEGFKAEVFNLDAAGLPAQRLDGLLTTATLFSTLQVVPAAGRFFAADDNRANAPCVAVIGFGVWHRVFNGDPAVVDRVVRLNDRACTIIGVAPRGFEFPRGGEMPAAFQYPARTELWVPAPPPARGPSDLAVLGRLAPSATMAIAQAQLDADARQRDLQIRGTKGWNAIRVVPLARQVVPSGIALTVDALFAAVTMLLAVAAGNATQLLVIRGLQRRREFVVRTALGASPWRLMRVAAIESILLTAVASVTATGIAAAGIQWIRRIGPERFPRLSELNMDATVTGFICAGAAVSALILAIGPMVLTRRASERGRIAEQGRGASDALRSVRTTLVGAQMALAVLLVLASGLLVRSFLERLRVDPGFRADHTLAFEVTLPAERYPEVLRGAMPADRPQTIAAIDAFLTHLRAIPGVVAAAIGKPLPMSGAQEATVFAAEGVPPPRTAADVPIAEYIVVSDDFFRTMGSPIRAGREFLPSDREQSERVVVVNETMAHQLWPDGSALGRHVKLGGTLASPAPLLTVVGIVNDTKRYGLDDKDGPAMYVNYTQGPYPTLSTVPFIVRTVDSDALALVPAVRAAAVAAGLDVPIAAPQTMTAALARVSADARFAMMLMIGLSIAAFALTIAGLYGVVAFAVSERRRELSIRSALGASPRMLIRLVLRNGMTPVFVGGAAGLDGAVLAGRVLRGLLFGISPVDPATFAVVPVLMLVAALAACIIPARRAARVDPRDTLGT